MPDHQFEIRRSFPVTPEELYSAWLDSETHGRMTGGGAEIDPRVGGRFTAWDGYIAGTTTELVANKKIVQAWRTLEFDDHDPDSQLEITLERSGDGTTLILRHRNIPDGQPDYETGWIDNYFSPMSDYFGTKKPPN